MTYPNRAHFLLPRATVLLSAALVLLVAPCAQAQKPIDFINNGKGVRNFAKQHTPENPKVVRISGELSYSDRSGLRIGKTRVAVSRTTGTFPVSMSEDGRIDTRRMSGRTATVYGRLTSKGLEASLLILDATPEDVSVLAQSKATAFGVPDPSQFEVHLGGDDEQVGELTDDAPR